VPKENGVAHPPRSLESVDLELEAASADEARAEVARMCEQLLANPLIESFEIELEHS